MGTGQHAQMVTANDTVLKPPEASFALHHHYRLDSYNVSTAVAQHAQKELSSLLVPWRRGKITHVLERWQTLM